MSVHFDFLLEEPSMEAFLQAWLPRFLPQCNFDTYRFQGKQNLLRNLEQRLRGYASWLPADYRIRIVIVVDRDLDDCTELKERLEHACTAAGLRSRRVAGTGAWQVVTRIAVEELEAWYFGDWAAVRQAYPRVPEYISRKAGFRHPDAIKGGTWEKFEKIMKKHGYNDGGLRKIVAARAIGDQIDAVRSVSPSFLCLANALREAAA